jgi:hypothetical protein
VRRQLSSSASVNTDDISQTSNGSSPQRSLEERAASVSAREWNCVAIEGVTAELVLTLLPIVSSVLLAYSLLSFGPGPNQRQLPVLPSGDVYGSYCGAQVHKH